MMRIPRFSKESAIYYFIGLLSAGPFLLLHKYRIPSFTYLCISIILLVGLIVLFSYRREKFIIRSVDIPVALLILWSALSSIWATNASLVWFQSFAYMQLFSIILFSRNIWLRINLRNAILYIYLTVLIFTLLQVFLFLFLGSEIENNAWHYIFGANQNYVSTYCLALLIPMVAFYRHQKHLLGQIIFISLQVLVLIVTKSVGASIAILIVNLLIYRSFLKKGYTVSIVMIGFAFLFYYIFRHSNIDDPFSQNYPRLYMIKSSLLLFKEQFMIGVGSGNWQIESYKYIPLSLQRDLFRLPGMGNHNLYTLVLSELGLIGFGLLFLSFKCYLSFFKSEINLLKECIGYLLLFYFIYAQYMGLVGC